MPKVNVYLPDDLATAVRDAGLPLSAICQQALADAVAAADSAPGSQPTDADDDQDAEMSRVTRRARQALDHARATGKGRGGKPTTVDLVDGLVAEGKNLALTVLRTLDVEPEDLLSELRALSRRRGAPRPEGLRAAGQRAIAEAARLGHNYVGCEHLLLGLADGPRDELVAVTLHGMGADAETVRKSVQSTIAGYAYARENLTFSGLSAPIRVALEDIRLRLSRLESR